MAKSGRKRKNKITLPGKGGAKVELVEVDSVYQKGKTELVERVVNRTSIDRIHGRGRLVGQGETAEDATARLRAAVRLQGIWETAGARGAGAMDYSAIKVDVSMCHDGTPEYQARALQDMARIRKFVGVQAFDILGAIICDDMQFMAYVENRWPQAGHKTRMDAYQALREALDKLIEYFGQAVGRSWVPMRASREPIPME